MSLVWTGVRPVHPGWYWFRRDDELNEAICCVLFGCKNFIANKDIEPIEAIKWFAGPIDSPGYAPFYCSGCGAPISAAGMCEPCLEAASP